jgi:hypothetical protein
MNAIWDYFHELTCYVKTLYIVIWAPIHELTCYVGTLYIAIILYVSFGWVDNFCPFKSWAWVLGGNDFGFLVDVGQDSM